MKGCTIGEGQLRWLQAQVKNLEERKNIGEGGITGTVSWKDGRIVGGRFQLELPEYVPSCASSRHVEVFLGTNGLDQLVLMSFRPLQVPAIANLHESDADPLTGIPYGELT